MKWLVMRSENIDRTIEALPMEGLQEGHCSHYLCKWVVVEAHTEEEAKSRGELGFDRMDTGEAQLTSVMRGLAPLTLIGKG